MTKAQIRLREARFSVWRALHRAEPWFSNRRLYEPMMFHRLLVQALFPAWNETVKELLARLSCARDLHSLLADTEVAPKSRKRFDDVRQELAESGLLHILNKVEREIIRSGFLSEPE